MAKRSYIEQLDDAIDAIIANQSLPDLNSRIQPLVRLAADLRGIPQAQFRARLKAELQQKAFEMNLAKTSMEDTDMQQATATVAPAGFHTVTPYLAVTQAAELIDFVKHALGAEETFRTTGSAGGLHAELRIGDSMIMIGGGGAWRGDQNLMALHLYVEDADAVYRKAIQAGAKSMYEPVNQEYGDREAGLWDLSGNEWYIATHQEPGKAKPEGLNSITPIVHAKGAAQMIDFMKQAFHAEVLNRYASDDGVIRHAVLRVGDSALELGEAHGQFQPLPSMFYLYVDNADAWYQQALNAGAVSEREPADQSYGDRVAAVRDPFGNTWYLATTKR